MLDCLMITEEVFDDFWEIGYIYDINAVILDFARYCGKDNLLKFHKPSMPLDAETLKMTRTLRNDIIKMINNRCICACSVWDVTTYKYDGNLCGGTKLSVLQSFISAGGIVKIGDFCTIDNNDLADNFLEIGIN